MWRGAGVDFGGSAGNPNAVAILGFTRDGHVHQYDEFAPAGVLSIEEIGGFISKWRQRAPMITVEGAHKERRSRLSARRSVFPPAAQRRSAKAWRSQTSFSRTTASPSIPPARSPSRSSTAIAGEKHSTRTHVSATRQRLQSIITPIAL